TKEGQRSLRREEHADSRLDGQGTRDCERSASVCGDPRVHGFSQSDRDHLRSGIGDVFGIRIAGNIVNDDELGSMEYATKVVGVKLVRGVGYPSCGSVKGPPDGEKRANLPGFLAKTRPAVSVSGPGSSKDDAYVTKVAQANVSPAMKEIRGKSPTIKQQLDA